jgi:homocitrate synthase NifV
MTKAVEFAKKHNLYISVNAEDASRSDLEFLVEFARQRPNAGADRLRFCDTIGVLEPFKTYDIIKELIEKPAWKSKCIPTMISAWQQPML